MYCNACIILLLVLADANPFIKVSKEEFGNNAIQTPRSKDKPNHRQRKEHSTTTIINCVDVKDMEQLKNPSIWGECLPSFTEENMDKHTSVQVYNSCEPTMNVCTQASYVTAVCNSCVHA